VVRTPLLSSDLCRRAVSARLPEGLQAAARTSIDLFRAELDEYAEIISAPPATALARVSGFMTRGEGPGFTERARVVSSNAGAEVSVVSEMMALASWCDHQRAYFKVEWHPHGDREAEGGEHDMVMASYFRRRPPLLQLQTYLHEQGIPGIALQHLGELAQLLGKTTPHFVAMALRPGFPAQYKIYFSQYVNAETAPAVRERVGRVLDTLAISPAALASWDAHHDGTLPQQLVEPAPDERVDEARAGAIEPAESSIFLSVSLTAEGLVPGIKIDYPEVTPAAVARWAAAQGVTAETAAHAGLAAMKAAAEVGSANLSYLGVRFLPHVAAPILKFYADRSIARGA
jgi:hypothetical protein